MTDNSSHVLSQADLNRQNLGQKRKTKPNWTKDAAAKRNRNSGLPYCGRNGTPHPALQLPTVGKVCGRCNKAGCAIPQAARNEMHSRFRSLDYNAQNLILTSCILLSSPKERRVPGNQSRRLHTFHYFINHDGHTIPICKRSLKNIFGVTDKRLVIVTKKLLEGQISPRDMRGRHSNRPNRIPDPVRQDIRNHIGQFPTYESHYARNRTAGNRRYLNPELTISEMYDMFIQDQRDNNRPEAAEWAYVDIYHSEFNLKIGDPKLDSCDKCDQQKARIANENNPNLRNDEILKWNKHKDISSASYRAYESDCQIARGDASYVVLTCDMQQVIFTPALKNSASFYLRKLSNYNFCIDSANNHTSYMHLWNETNGRRGSNEVASCLWSFVRRNYSPIGNHNRTLVVWADRCTGQNNNNILLSMLVRLVRLDYFTVVHQKFFSTGHSYNSCDRSFGHIERKLRKSSVLIPSDIATLIRNVSESNPFVVANIDRRQFLDFKTSWHLMRTPASLQVTKFLWFSYSKNSPDVILSRETHAMDVWNQHRLGNLQAFDLVQLHSAYSNPLPISAEKRANLRKLLLYLEGEARDFYLQL